MTHKEPHFHPEYFSGLNWRDAQHLVGKVVEFSQDGTVWTDRGKLLEIFEHERRTCRYRRDGYLDYFIYIRTTPETYAQAWADWWNEVVVKAVQP